MRKGKKKYAADGVPIKEAFDTEEEYQKAYDKYLEEFWAEVEDMLEHSRRWEAAHPEIVAERNRTAAYS